MAFIDWREDYNLGIKEIDDQHQKMVEIINRLFELSNENEIDNQEKIETVLKEASDYAVYHFATEEKYFDLFKYEKSESHIDIHNKYRAKIKELSEKYQQTKDKTVFFELTDFLQDWWVWHINNTDREYVALFKANGL